MDKVFNSVILPTMQVGINERNAPANESRNLYIYRWSWVLHGT